MFDTTSRKSISFGLDYVLAAEHQQLPCQARRPPPPRNKSVCTESIISGPSPCLRQQQPGMTLDDRQHVVEIMRHPRRQLADRFHLLRIGATAPPGSAGP